MELWAFILLGLGLVFIILEVFVPSGGLIGTIAAGCVIAGGVFAYRGEDVFLLYIVLAFVLGPLAAMFGLKLFPHTPFGKRLMLGGSSFDADESAVGGGTLDNLLDQTGVADTPLRPSGKVLVNGRRIDVTTRGELIDRGRAVRVIRVEGNRVFVAESRNDHTNRQNP